MEWLREVSRWSHVIIGFVGLLAFWFPIVARKGGTLHRKAGTVFLFCGYWVCGTAVLSCALIAAPALSEGLTMAKLSALAPVVFLTYLALVTFSFLRFSMGVLRTKKDPTALGTPGFRALTALTLTATPALVTYALLIDSSWRVVLLALSPLGLVSGWPMWRYMSGKVSSKRAWFYEHMAAMLGAGIAFHTAFAVFGASRLFDLPLSGAAAVIPWLLPTLIGVPALVIWKRHYQRKFGELPKKPMPAADTLPAA